MQEPTPAADEKAVKEETTTGKQKEKKKKKKKQRKKKTQNVENTTTIVSAVNLTEASESPVINEEHNQMIARMLLQEKFRRRKQSLRKTSALQGEMQNAQQMQKYREMIQNADSGEFNLAAEYLHQMNPKYEQELLKLRGIPISDEELQTKSVGATTGTQSEIGTVLHAV